MPRRPDADSYAGLRPTESDVEDLARTAVCPNCGAQPLRRCISNDRSKDGLPLPMYSSHLGRLLAARAEQP